MQRRVPLRAHLMLCRWLCQRQQLATGSGRGENSAQLLSKWCFLEAQQHTPAAGQRSNATVPDDRKQLQHPYQLHLASCACFARQLASPNVLGASSTFDSRDTSHEHALGQDGDGTVDPAPLWRYSLVLCSCNPLRWMLSRGLDLALHQDLLAGTCASDVGMVGCVAM